MNTVPGPIRADRPGKTSTAETGVRREMTFVVYEDNSHHWRWHLVSNRGDVLADSSKSYAREQNALGAVQKIQKSIVGAQVETRA